MTKDVSTARNVTLPMASALKLARRGNLRHREFGFHIFGSRSSEEDALQMDSSRASASRGLVRVALPIKKKEEVGHKSAVENRRYGS